MYPTNWKNEGLIGGLFWGLFLILVGILFFTQNQGWVGEHGWQYFAIGLGSLLIIESLVRYFIYQNFRHTFDRFIIGVAVIYLGAAFLFGIGNWWPIALVSLGVIILLNALWKNKHQSHSA